MIRITACKINYVSQELLHNIRCEFRKGFSFFSSLSFLSQFTPENGTLTTVLWTKVVKYIKGYAKF